MPSVPLNLIKGDKIGSETDYRDALPVNMYGVVRPMFGSAGYMIQMQGIKFFTTGIGADRRGIWNERFKQHYRVSGDNLISVDSSGFVTDLGSTPGADVASMPYSFNTQGVISDGRFWLYSPSSGLNEVLDPELGNPIDCVWIDNYYFLTDGDFVYHTDITDETSIDPLKFATAEYMPDDTLGVDKTQDNKVMVFGRYTIEYFVNDATEFFAFRRLPTRALKVGIVGTHCKVEMGGKHYILGGRKEESVSIHAVTVGGVLTVATREVDKILSEYTESELVNASLSAYDLDGYAFILVNLPRHTLLFNETLATKVGVDQSWSLLKTGVKNDIWPGAFPIFDPRRSQWVLGNRGGDSIGSLDVDLATVYGDIAEWILFTPFVYLDSLSIDQIEIETMPGHTGSSDASVFISLTYNGVTYGKEWSEMYGNPNDYSKNFIIRRLGNVDNWVGIKLRGATTSRMAFSRGVMNVG